MNHLSIKMNPRDKGTLPSYTFPNLKNDVHCMEIVTSSGKVLEDAKVAPNKNANENLYDGVKPSAPIHIVIGEELSKQSNVNVREKKGIDPPKVMVDVETRNKSTKGNGPKCPLQYSQTVIKKKEDEHFQKFVNQLNKLSVNMPLIDALL